MSLDLYFREGKEDRDAYLAVANDRSGSSSECSRGLSLNHGSAAVSSLAELAPSTLGAGEDRLGWLLLVDGQVGTTTALVGRLLAAALGADASERARLPDSRTGGYLSAPASNNLIALPNGCRRLGAESVTSDRPRLGILVSEAEFPHPFRAR